MNITKYFPLTGVITEEIIATANVKNIFDCIGAKTLQAAMNKIGISGKARWGAADSCSTEIDGKAVAEHGYKITTEEGIDMMMVTHPQEVTFILKKI